MSFMSSKFSFYEVKDHFEFSLIWHKINLEYDLSNGLFGRIEKCEKFIELCKHRSRVCYLCHYGKKPVGFCILDHFEGKSARVHFFTFSSSKRIRIDGGKEFIGRLLHMSRDGKYWLDALYGVIPKRNEIAQKYASLLGIKWLASAPSLHYNKETGRGEDVVIGYFNREVYYDFTGKSEKNFEWMLF